MSSILRSRSGSGSSRIGLMLAVLGAGMLTAYVAVMVAFPRAGGRIVAGDAAHHFVQLRSLVFDRDLHFQNEYVQLYGLEGGEPDTEWVSADRTVTGHVRNYMPVGPALLWLPAYLAAAAAQWLLALAGLAPRPDGFDWMLQLAPGITGILAATAGALISWRMASRSTTPAIAAVATVGVWVGTHALYYSLVSPAYSHAASMLTSAAFFSTWLATRDRPSVARGAVWGALAGAAALMRWQDALFIVVPLIEVARWPSSWSDRVKGAAAATLAWIAVFSPQMLVWNALYGQPFALPQGPSFMRWTSPHPVDVLFSENHGLFTWAPLLVLSVVGLVGFMKRHRATIAPLVVVIIGSWYVNAAVADWWAGEAFGARRFLSLFPLFILGLATWLHGAETSPAFMRRAGLTAVLVGANLLLLLQYQLCLKGLEAVAPCPQGWFDMWIARFVVPARLLAWWAA